MMYRNLLYKNQLMEQPNNGLQYRLKIGQYGMRCFFAALLRYAVLTAILYLNQKIERGGMAPRARESRQTML